ncbi:FecR family protein [Sphingobium boeckii]|uniref:Transmembrane sensor n=1 Tax=Sphingobium boeckii TaxID=1082345 RepID=A0A7W9AJG8_9SPHN|nr:FecR domain-containing protein [Sphingobium boeckii]MBB5686596.1 transmembrane sensor [Sphingobium boeckii]
MSRPHANIEEAAIGWIIRMRDPAFAGWDAFTLWLEEDPVHAAIYDELALADADAADVLAETEPVKPEPVAPPPPPRDPIPANDDKPERPRWATRRSMVGWAMAASLLGVASYTSLMPGSSPYAVETLAGQRQSVTLADGSRIDLNGATRLMLDRENPRFARLERGEALFSVVHDARRPFTVETGGATLVDAGTAFNVIRLDGMTEVSVSEGVVIYNPKVEKVTLAAGKVLRALDADGQIRVGNIDAGSVAAWKQGRLIYEGTPLSAVAADLSRNLGFGVTAGRDVAARPFSGVIQIEGDRERVRQRVSAVLGVPVDQAGGGWRLGADAAR